MFTSLKNKIKEETGNDVCVTLPTFSSHRRNSLILSNLNNNNNVDISQNGGISPQSPIGISNNNQRNSTIISPIDQLNDVIAKKNAEIADLVEKLNDTEDKFNKLTAKHDESLEMNKRVEKTNSSLADALKVTQEQTVLMNDEQDKIQNLQAQEISKLKSLLHFREQEAIDRLTKIKQKDNELEQFQFENVRLREIETNFENVQDELEKLRRSSQMDKNSLTATLASVEEQNRHLASKLQIYEEGRISFTLNQSNDEKMQILLRERRMLEQRLEEAHLHLSDIKSTWSAQNMALETQVDRLSRQVAAETTEKRKAINAHDELAEKCKQLSFQLEKSAADVEQRDQKIKLMSEEIDDLSSTYQELKDQNGEEMTFLRNKVNKSTVTIDELKQSLESAMERLSSQSDEADQVIKSLNVRVDAMQHNLQRLQCELDEEKKEKNCLLLKNVEISQELRKELQENGDMYETMQSLTEQIHKLEARLKDHHQQIENIEDFKNEISDKNKTIKMLNQRLADMKKTLQNELKSSGNEKVGASVVNGNTTKANIDAAVSNGHNENENDQQHSVHTNSNKNALPLVMDDVNLKYLKHVILKFMTSREVEARHLIRAIRTLLNLSNEEEQLLHETLNFKVGWFGSRSADLAARNRHHKLSSVLRS